MLQKNNSRKLKVIETRYQLLLKMYKTHEFEFLKPLREIPLKSYSSPFLLEFMTRLMSADTIHMKCTACLPLKLLVHKANSN